MQTAVQEWYAKKQVLDSGEALTMVSARRAMATARTGAFGHALEVAYDWHLLPEAYVYGLAQLESHAVLPRTYLRGEQSVRGFRSYFSPGVPLQDADSDHRRDRVSRCSSRSDRAGGSRSS